MAIDYQEKAIERLRTARRYVQWNITKMRNGEVFPNGINVVELQQAKSIITGVLEEVEEWKPNGNGGVVIIDNPKPDWMPRMVCTIVQLPFNVGEHYSWEELEWVVIQLSLAGCDSIRIFANGWKPYVEMYKKMTNSGEYSFFKPNPEYDEILVGFRDMLHKYHMSLEVDLYDNCSHKLEWNPFTTTHHGFSKYFYGYTKMIKSNELDEEGNVIMLNEVDFMMKYHDNRIMALLKPEKGDKVRLGNELRSHVENKPSELKWWAEKWGADRALNIFNHGFPQPVSFSGSTKTAHKLHGFISAEEHGPDAHPHNGDDFPCEDYGWTYRTSGLEVHGKGTPAHVHAWGEPGISQRRVFCIDDDGVGTNPDSQVPPDQRGYCEIRSNGSEYACTANTATRVEAVRAFISYLKNVTYCYSIGFLPRSILYHDKTDLSRFDVEVDAAIYTRIAADLWGVDIRRRQAS
jgi:hypothetical protein